MRAILVRLAAFVSLTTAAITLYALPYLSVTVR
jgi:hypothetical protein